MGRFLEKKLSVQSLDLLLKPYKDTAVRAEVIEKIGYLKALKAKERALLLEQINREDGSNSLLSIRGFNTLLLAAHHCPEALPDLLRFIKTLPFVAQKTIFEQTHACWIELFKHAALFSLPLTQELLKIVPVAIQQAMVKQTDENGDNLLRVLAIEAIYLGKTDRLIEILRCIKGLSLATQGEIFTQLNSEGENFLIFVAKQASFESNVLPAALELMQVFPKAVLASIFKQVDQWKCSALWQLSRKNVFPAVLELIKKLPVTDQEIIFQQRVTSGEWDILAGIKWRPPKEVLSMLRIIRKFSQEVREEILQRKDRSGECFEFYMVYNGNSVLLENLRVLGINFNREVKVKDRYDEGLLKYAVEFNKCDMLSVLISEYGLKPNIKSLVRYANSLRKREMMALCTPKYLEDLYAAYLNSLNLSVREEVEHAMLPFPTVLTSMISGYLSFDFKSPIDNSHELKILELSIERALKLRAEWLKPLFEYCEQKELDGEALTCLKTLLASKKLGPYALEKELDALLNQDRFEEKAYAPSVIHCRLNTEKLTGNKSAFSMKVKAAFQFKVLCAGAAISVLTLAVGLMALCMLNALVAGVAVTALSSIALGGLAYGFYAHKKNTNIPQHVGPALICI